MDLSSRMKFSFCLTFLALLLGRLPADAADQALIDAAKKEGEVVWYTTFVVDQLVRPVAEAFQKISASAGKSRRAVLIIDEGDSLASARSQEHSHHEDKVAVNTLIQGIDDLRRHGGRILTFLCTNRLSVLDPALQRRAAIVQEFRRPDEKQRKALLDMDLVGLKLTPAQVTELVKLTGAHDKRPIWTYSDFRTRWYPAALARAFPARALQFEDLLETAKELVPSPVVEDR